ncbi:excinuclease ABC subunit UvrC [Marinimicrobium sp. C6131]|uniref:excinuclease ABC subunit UvrC n=1 Tax=Marinimicrobium sp. C6131 TaxID=3022676 RepID=UPI00223E2AF2|nr:excinuclease ABC subunit UvrC [Marinimicrobium sp. C6131]UZJ45372.1 excinuclease ABC subunit UvrC [Marinimicrobium sp. C6131]
MCNPAAPDAFDATRFLANTTQQPGIYQMYDGEGKLLYVGKAKNLKKRLSSYFRKTGLPPKTAALVAKIQQIDVTVTASETEALILEQNLIKSHRPPYNILLRDDKSYPYIFLSSAETFPRISFHRGSKKKRGHYFGPYPNVGAVRDSMNFLQKTFQVRQCEDSVFKNRSRPCLQYQIKRCTAPCVDYISPEDYAEDVRHTRMFLSGDSDTLLKELADQMDAASQALDFERAAALRDQITALRSIQSQNLIEEGYGDLDVVAAVLQAGLICVHVLFVRQGRILGSRSYYPQASLADSETDVLAEFLPQFYLASEGREIPREIVTSHPVAEAELIAQALKSASGRQVTVTDKVRTHRSQWVQMATTAAQQNLSSRVNSRKNSMDRFIALQDALGLDEMPQRLECFDISHSSGELTQASCVVFDTNGPLKSDYRRFNIEGITPGDDYAAMEQALQRRYTRLQKGEGKLPDILIIDGGKGQLGKAQAVLAELGVNNVPLLGVAKGTTRKAGFETLYWAETGKEFVMSSDSPALHLLQHIRDEAHRFAITGHRQRRDKKRRTSSLEGVPGIGAGRRRELLRHFGGLQEVQKASVADLAKVPGISKRLAEEIYGHFHG